MLPRNTSKSFKGNNQNQINNAQYLDSDDPKLRILQYDLVFVNGLPSSIASLQILTQDLYFGRYGKVIKSILNPPYPFKKGITYQAYATYQNQLDSSLAIVALDGIILQNRPLKVSYGTTKYCSYFLKGRQCTNNDCFYLHKIQKSKQVVNGDTKTVFKHQNQRAIDIVLKNLDIIIERILDSKNEGIEEGFPSLTQLIQFLIENEYIDPDYYEKLYQKIKKQKQMAKKETSLQIPEKLSSSKSKQQILNMDSMYDGPKLIKSNSFSTMATPSKPAASTQFDEQEKPIYDIEQNKCKLVQKFNQQYDDRTVRSDNQNKKSSQINFDRDSNLQQKIQQKIIKEILKKNSNRSKFDFASNDKENPQALSDVKKVKNIIQRFLITYQ